MRLKGKQFYKNHATDPRSRAEEEALVREYERFLAKHGLPRMSAEELIHERLTPGQRRWVSDFIVRWDAWMKRTYRQNPAMPAGIHHRDEAVRVGVTYQWVTPESAARGDYEDHGWHREKELMSFREAVEVIKRFMPYDADQPQLDAFDDPHMAMSRLWFKGVQEEQDPRDGSVTTYDVVIEGDTITLGRLERWYHSYLRRGR